MFILGINAYHGDSSACLVKDGVLVVAAEEERFRRAKHWAGFPSESIQYCLRQSSLLLSDVDYIAINTDPKANIFKKINYALRKKPDLKFVADRIRNARERLSIQKEMQIAFKGQSFLGEVKYVEHHLSHLASCYLVSNFDESVIVSVDGFGDFASAAWGVGENNKVSVDRRVYFPHSLGIFYQALTQFLGFYNYGDEYKVMGLAPYGEPVYLDKMHQLVELQNDGGFKLNLDYFRHHAEKIDYEWSGGSPTLGCLFSDALSELLGPARDKNEPLTDHHKNIARSIQAMYEEAFFHLLNNLHTKYKIDSLSLAGGCAMNSVANGKIRRNTPFKKIYIQSAAGDAGGAIGAALVVAHNEKKDSKRFYMNHAYWGPEFSNTEIGVKIDANSEALERENCHVEFMEKETVLCETTATAIAKGKVIGWFQGRMEWGPRALGNRSILGDPRRADMKDILNLKIKRRESFRPFAPSILRESVSEWFEEDDDVPFMMKVFQIKEKQRKKVPAVTHVDGSGRLQTVTKDTNPRYYQLIEAFNEKTGIPLVLNTSFNENEPVVCNPQEALDCFLRTKMDVLVLGNYYISRKIDD